MSNDETQQTTAAEIPEVQLSETEMEQVAGGIDPAELILIMLGLSDPPSC